MEMLNRRQRKQREYRRVKRQHTTRLVLICCSIVAASGCFFWSPGLAVFSDNVSGTSQQGIILQEAAQPVMDYSTPPVMRDPFAVPQEFQPVSPVVASPLSARNYASVPNSVAPQPAMPEISLELVGVVSGGGQKVAIIKNTGNSHSYQIKDYIGPYQLLSVGENSATLWGPQGKKVLTLER